MHKFIRKYYQELIAVALIAGFWGSVWSYHEYQNARAASFRAAHTFPYNPSLFN